MDDDVVSDEEQYENESFENDSECEVPEGIDDSSDNENENESKACPNDRPDNDVNNSTEEYDPDLEPENNIYAYTRKQISRARSSLRNQDYVQYTSSSDDEADVVISKTIAEINTQPMLMDIAATPKTPHTKSAIALMEVQKSILATPNSVSRKQISKETTTDTESESGSESEPESDSVSEPEVKITEKITKTTNENKFETSEEVCLSLRTNISHCRSEQDSSGKEQIDNDTESNDVDNEEDDDIVNGGDNERCFKESQHHVLSPKYIQEHQLLRSNDPAHIGLVPENYEDEKKVSENSAPGINIEAQEYGEPHIDYCISSRTPSNFNSDDYAFHMNFMHKSSSGSVKLRSGQRKSWSFSNERMREIDRQNQILLKKILTQKPTYSLNPKNTKSNVHSRSLTSFSSATRLTTAALNRKKQQRQIDLDNLVLKRKIEAISSRRPTSKN